MSTATLSQLATETTWTAVCRLADILPNTGAAALIGRRQVAVVRYRPRQGAETVHALGNFDPFSQAFVIARGIVGDAQGTPMIASPIYKQRFRLADGGCIDDPSVSLPTWPCRVRDGVVEVALAS
ncbi:nitrite reductase small subunit [Planctomycetota bacterium]|nr:nitrite reductase small subunit [Planctomycetota bacterium]